MDIEDCIERMEIIENTLRYSSAVENKPIIKKLFDENKEVWKGIEKNIEKLCDNAESFNIKAVRKGKREIDAGIKRYKINVMRINEFLI
jgi:hypothetical protein